MPDISFVAFTQAEIDLVPSIIVAKPPGVVKDDLMLALLAVSTSASYPTTAPAGWTRIHANPDTSLSQVWYKVAGDAEPADYTWTFAASARCIIAVAAYRDVDPANPINAPAIPFAFTSNVFVTDHNTAAITTTRANCLLVALYRGDTKTILWTHNQGRAERYEFGPVSAGMNAKLTLSDALQVLAGASGEQDAATNGNDTSHGYLIALAPPLAVSSAGAGRGAGIVRPPAVPSAYRPVPQRVEVQRPIRGPVRVPGRRAG